MTTEVSASAGSPTLIVISRLVSVSLTPACEYVSLVCSACGAEVNLDQTIVLDWHDNALVHSVCIPLYIEQFIQVRPELTIAELMVIFGASRRTVTRRRRGVHSNGTS